MTRADASSDSSSLASWEEIDHDDSCFKDIDTSDSVKPSHKVFRDNLLEHLVFHSNILYLN